MLISNFHTHTYLCQHAQGNPIDYAKYAEKEGCSALGFSDHCPYPTSIWADSHMAVSELTLYQRLVQEAAEAVNFPVYFGFECEWHPDYRAWYEDTLIGEMGAEYLVFGSHWLPEYNKELTYIPCINEKKHLHKYIDFTISGMQTGLYAFLAHPDLFLYAVEKIDADIISCCDALIDCAIDLNMPLEINGYGLYKETTYRNGKKEPRYPVPVFWERARDAGAIIICNSDAHYPEHTIAGVRRAQEFARRLNITPADSAQALHFDYIDA